jgi:amino acid transporter
MAGPGGAPEQYVEKIDVPPAGAATTMSPSEEIPPLNDRELELLREVGRHWADAIGPRGRQLRALPVDPTLGRVSKRLKPTRFGRITPVEMFEPRRRGEAVAKEPAEAPPSRLGRLALTVRRIIVGPPLSSSALIQERMRKLIALPVLGSDLLSSVAYGPEAMLSVLVLAGTAGLAFSAPIAAVLVLLMVVVGISYRQTIRAYPSGAGSYIVAGDNLGEVAGLAAAIGLMTDYILTVAVSIAAGVAAVTSAIPALGPYAVGLGLIAIGILLAGNLRGVRQAGAAFAWPTYAFVAGIFLLIGAGLVAAAARGWQAIPPPAIKPVEAVGVLLILRAFTSGATSMTGIEASSNAIPAFQPVEWRNARSTLSWMVGLLVIMFVGLMAVISLEGVVPKGGETVLSQLGHRLLGGGPLYAYVQATSALVLFFAANTAFNDFPRLLYFMARHHHAPRIFLRMGDRLAFSNGIIALAIVAALLFVAFRGMTEKLIPLYAVGVFVAFTLSQSGMVVHWLRHREPHWRKSMAMNGMGAALCAVVLVTAATTKFTEGAWVVVIGMPLLIVLGLRIRHHYQTEQREIAIHPLPAGIPKRAIVPALPSLVAPETDDSGMPEREESPDEVRHLIAVAIARFDLASLRALAYAASFDQPVLAVHISPDEEEARRFRHYWSVWGAHLRLEVIVSPYRAIVGPLANYLEALHALRPGVVLTVVLPELVARRAWHQALHARVAARVRRQLRWESGVVVTTVPFHLSC